MLSARDYHNTFLIKGKAGEARLFAYKAIIFVLFGEGRKMQRHDRNGASASANLHGDHV